jgi:hypothetical protein
MPQLSSLTILRPVLSQIYEETVRGKLRAVVCSAMQNASIECNIVDSEGNNVSIDLTNVSVVAKFKEAVQYKHGPPPVTANGAIVNAATGLVRVPIPTQAVEVPGISRVEIGILQNSSLVYVNTLYLYVQRSLWSLDKNNAGPPDIDEVKLYLRDSSKVENLWLGREEFDVPEIAFAAVQPVVFFNETPPPINLKYNTSNFPFHHHWIKAIVANLYFIAARHYRRVHLQYQITGGAVDDTNKSQEYEAIGAKLWEEYTRWVTFKKVQLNAEEAYGAVLSPYSYQFGHSNV